MDKPIKFKVCIKGEAMANQTVTFTLTVNPPVGAPLVVKDAGGNVIADGATVPLANETVGVNDPGQEVFNVSGGTAPYNFSVSAGAVPDGMQLNSTSNPDGSETVTLAGTPTTAGAASFTVLIADSAGATVKANVKVIGK